MISEDERQERLRTEWDAAVGRVPQARRLPSVSDDAAGRMLREMLNPEIPPGPPYVHTLVHPEIAYKPEKVTGWERIFTWWRHICGERR